MVEDDFLGGSDNPFDSSNSLTEPAAQAQVEADQHYRSLAHAYTAVFSGKASKGDVAVCMDDLMKFCRLFETTAPVAGLVPTWTPEVLEGRRQVALRIMEFSRLTPDQLFNRYHKRG